jgi:hypothetical protein
MNTRQFDEINHYNEHIGISSEVQSNIVVKPTNKYFVYERQQLGRVLTAKRCFNIGDLILREKPSVIFRNHQDLINQINRWNVNERLTISHMHSIRHINECVFPQSKQVITTLWLESIDIFTQIESNHLRQQLI